jgi:flagellar M-ring protein FliF
MDAQKFGISQFAEQVNYQRALAGELSRTVESMAAVQGARVHLAIPRPTVFVREQQQPSASVLVSLYPGRLLDAGQVNAIQHLVASGVPQLEARNVTVVDQAGNLLSGTAAAAPGMGGLDASQLKYLHAVESSYAARIENILKPIVGPDNVRAQVTAALDFSQVEQTSETFKPNPAPQESAIRSQQTVETVTVNPQGPTGVPGALSNQPPGAATAPLTALPAAQTQQQATSQPPANTHRENIVNYEVDKTIRHTRGEVGGIKRLSAAVVVNYRRGPDSDGKPTYTALSEQEVAQITALAREAMGFSQERGDTLNVVNAPFSGEAVVAGLEAPNEWAETIRRLTSPSSVFSMFLYGIAGIALLVALLLVRSAVRDLTRAGQRAGPGGAGGPIEPQLAGAGAYGAAPEPGYEADLRAVKDLARQEPRVVANVVKDWVGQ